MYGTKKTDLSILIVNWNAAGLTTACLDSIERTSPQELRIEIIIVDNGSARDDFQVIAARARRDGLRMIQSDSNVGFAAANNMALRVAEGRYILLLNNDTQVMKDALEILVRYMEMHPETGIAGAHLIGLDGKPQFSHDLFPLTPWRLAFERVLDKLLSDNDVTRRSKIKRWGDNPQSPFEVDWVLGAAAIVRRQVVEQVGLLDEGYFMYAEDIDWCYRIKKAGWQVMHIPQATIVHIGGGSSIQHPELVQILNDRRNNSLVRFYRLHYGKGAAVGMQIILRYKEFSRQWINLKKPKRLAIL